MDEDLLEVILPIMVNITPSDAPLPSDVAVSFLVTDGTAKSKGSM